MSSTTGDIAWAARRLLTQLQDCAPDTGDVQTQACLDEALSAIEEFCTELLRDES
ncbi:hypothetical protein [Gephyromycinifex aptenodytis]|uniref:hypothetical protein n=1 Tax=Gephyromycinifex aptenodytis TaxID=2716227 RepID=UPI001444FCF1|nr:hypothetical protein [Gephyromycinifex aptenodytis]